ncbi:MAG TPA: type II toxin-antitoxin system HicA family toxin [bacterium]|nr:type II toxin-antitoxin system HicA family toxin [bacterium]
MARLPRISGKQAVEIFKKLGWSAVRRTGSHVILTKKGNIATLSIPQHKELAPGTLRALIRNAGTTVEEFVNLSR